MSLIYLVEDDESIRELILYAMRNSGYQTVGYETGEELFAALEEKIPSLVLLDVMLPGDSGLDILAKIRDKSAYKDLPVIMLTAKNSEYDRVKGLDLGADDYIGKPFGVMELISRTKAVLRRYSKKSDAKLMSYEAISIDDAKHAVVAGDNSVELTYKEYELLKYLIANQTIVLSRESIMNVVWGFDFEGESRTVDMHIKTLRQKLGEHGKLIKTVRNVGYKIGD